MNSLDNKLTAYDWEAAYTDVQGAINSQAIVNYMARVAPKIRTEVKTTEEFNQHPIIQLCLIQLCHLAGLSVKGIHYYAFTEHCKQKVKELTYGS